jgi:hypothetical protein
MSKLPMFMGIAVGILNKPGLDAGDPAASYFNSPLTISLRRNHHKPKSP